MKKLILGFLFSLGISSALFAQTDLISLATNGVYNEQSKGVKVLSNEKMAQVVGGAYVSSSFSHQYGARNNSNVTVSYTAYYRLYDSYANELRPLNVDDGSGKYVPVVQATLNHLNNSVSISIIGMNQYNPVYTRSADRYYANKILTDNKTSFMNTINGVIRNHTQTYWKNH